MFIRIIGWGVLLTFAVFSQRFFPCKEQCRSEHFKYDLGLCTIFENEAEYMPEWIEFHRKQGVQKIWLYFNGKGDGHRGILADYVASGFVELIDWPSKEGTKREWNRVQLGEYNHCLDKVRNIPKLLQESVFDGVSFASDFSPESRAVSMNTSSRFSQKIRRTSLSNFQFLKNEPKTQVYNKKIPRRLLFADNVENSIRAKECLSEELDDSILRVR